ncbi:hypothetical protein CU669_11820 [Paramagnetospirillum kuznetsovii]|uniref:histidine kinase n=1 Tax=Paramagnetospirillum kuznetsovii TaxID=2053833 RepID=A0A364NX35_9PROT|nr:PocR ligand-binding domain-containing protein [Paramagnetospirillum kuznetsovii]RAU21661.1 hypothetical protein CU669_11820 [Paramagnetospirillum kuznetsovii]
MSRKFPTRQDFTLFDLFSLEQLQRLQDDFSAATGVASLITDINGKPITNPSGFCRLCKDIVRKTPLGLRNCENSDAILGGGFYAAATIRQCSSIGLWDAGASIVVDGKHLANWLIGQVRDETQTEIQIRDYARDIGADEDETLRAFLEVPYMRLDKFQAIANFLNHVANNICHSAFLQKKQSLQNAKLERINEDIDQLARVMAHHMQEPVRLQFIYSQKLEKAVHEGDGDDIELFIHYIKSNAVDLKALMLSIQFYLDTPYEISSPERCNAFDAFNSAVGALREKLDEVSAVLNVADLPEVCISGHLLKLVFKELIINSIENSRPDHPLKISVLSENVEGYTVLKLQDNGVGIVAEYRDRVFNICERLERTKFGKSGMGLPHIRKIIESVGGCVFIESDDTTGVCVNIYIPDN